LLGIFEYVDNNYIRRENMKIEVCKKNDLLEILELQKLCYQESAILHENNKIQPLTQSVGSIENEFESGTIFVLKDDNKNIIGSIRGSVENNICHIYKLIVHPTFQNKGYGALLLKHIEDSYSCCTKYSLFTAKKIEKNIGFYSKYGYKIIDEKLQGDMWFVYMEKVNSK
jgi:ribosomal protein S18 acetylase RimI-like enzyme